MIIRRHRKWLLSALSVMLVIQLCFGTSGIFEGEVYADKAGTVDLSPERSDLEQDEESNEIDIHSDISEDTTVTEYIYEDDQTGTIGNGLLGEYYDDIHFKKLVFSRIDQTIDFNWGFKAPDPDIHGSSFSVRWTGQVQPQYTGKYTFYTYTNGGVRLWVNGKRIIDEWSLLFSKESKGTIEVTAGEKYDILMEYQEGMGSAKAILSWSSKEQKKQVIPQERLYCIPKAPEGIKATPSTTSVALVWNEVTGADSYDIKLNDEIITGIGGNQYICEGLTSDTEYTFRVRSMNSFGNSEWSGAVTVSTLEVQDAATGNGNGLAGKYYDNIIFKKLLLERVDKTIDFDWGNGAPDPNIRKNTFSVKWEGKLLPKYTAKHTIYLYSDDGAKLWVNGKELIDFWKPHNSKEGSATIDLIGGEKCDIRIEYFNINKEAGVKLYWSNPYEDKVIIPMEQLYTIPGITGKMEAVAEGSKIDITWENTPGAESYELEVDGTVVNVGMEARYEHNGLTPNSQHTYRVRAVNEVGKGEWSGFITKTSAPPTPANLTAVVDTTQISVSWEASAEAAAYDIEVDGTIIDNGDSTSYLHTGLNPNTKCTYRVRSKNENGISDWSEMLTKTTLPATPDNVSAEPESRSMSIAWNSVEGAISYEIEVDGQLVPGIADTSYTFESLSPDTAHTYRVRARNIEGAGYWSEPITKKTLLETPIGITADITDRSVSLFWSPVNNATGYEIEIDESDTAYTTEVNFVNEGLLPNSEHSYRIRAKNEDNLSEWSDRITRLTLPDIPKNLASASTSYKIDLTWEAVPGAVSYEIEADSSIIGKASDTAFIHEGLQPLTGYTYRVRAINIAGAGYWSQSISETTKIGVPANINAVSTSKTITFEWNGESEADRYEIELDGIIYNNDLETIYEYVDLLPNSAHTYRVRAINEVGYGDWSELTTKVTSPDIPGNISAASTSTSITLTWNEVEAAEGYDVEILGSPVDNGNSISYTHQGLSPNTQRTYRVRAKNENGLGDWSAIIAKSTLAAAPSNLTTSATETAIRLSWDQVAGATSYDVETDGVLHTDILSAEYELSGLSPYSQHTFRVRSRNEDGISDWSAEITGSTLPAIPVVTLSEATDSSVRTVWESVYGASGYDMEADGLIIDCGLVNEYVHQNLMPNTKHLYRVRTRSEYGTGNWSEPVERLTLPDIPQNVEARATSSTVNLIWNSVDGAIGYEIESGGVITNTGINTSYQYEKLEPNTEYIYRVRAINEAGAGNWSFEVKAFTLLGVPQNIKAFSTGSNIKLVWDEVYGVTGYEVEADGSSIDIGPVEEYLHADLMPNTAHIYRLRAKVDDNMGDWSQPLVANTLLASIADVKAVSTNTSITLSWTPIGDAENYEVEADGNILAGILEPTYKLEGLLPNTSHTFRVMAKNGTNTSDWSNMLTKYTTPDIPGNVLTSATTSAITVAWDAVVGAVGYDIEVDGTVINNETKINYTQEGLTPNTQHIYRVRARNEFEASEWSMQIISTTEPEFVFNIAEDNLFNFVIAAPKVEGETERSITVTYNPEELEAIDLCAATPEQNINVGDIKGTNLEIKEYTPGTIVLSLKDPSQAIMNAVKFKAKVNGQAKILYVIK